MSQATIGNTFQGEILNLHSRRNSIPAMELQVDFINVLGGDSQLGGLSGSPVFVSDQDNLVAALVHWTPPPSADQKQFATPIDEALEFLLSQLPNLHIADWREEPERQTVDLEILRDTAGDLRVECSEEWPQIAQVWNSPHPPLRIECRFLPHQHPALASAVLRLALHARSVQIATPQSEDWKKEGRKLGRLWIPLLHSPLEDSLDRIAWRELAGISAVAVTEAATADEAIAAINEACDKWVLEELCRRVHAVLGEANTSHDLAYQIHQDLREPMEAMWAEWREKLAVNPELLRHFLTLMLTREGNFQTARAVVGAGPLTAEKCLVQAVMFSLAVNTCLSPSHQLKAIGPGNVGVPEQDAGHICGIQAFEDQSLVLSVNSYGWPTPVVFLHHLQNSPSFIRAMQTRENQVPGGPALSLRHSFPDTLLLTADAELLGAIGAGRGALAEALQNRRRQWAEAQEAYKNEIRKLA